MPADVTTLALRLQGEQYTREIIRARRETNQMSVATRALARRLRETRAASRRFKSSTNDMAATITKASAIFAAAYGARTFARFTSGAIQAGAAAEETANKFAEVFKSVEGGANQAAREYSQAFDVAGSTAQRLLADTGDLLVGFGFSEAAALDLSKQVNTLAADLASFQNFEGGAARASQALTKALVGETEQAKALGIVIRQGTKEYQDRVKRIMESQKVSILQAKALANLQIAAEQSQKAMGDYGRTSQSTSNLIKANGEAVKEFTESFGLAAKAILPVDAGLKATKDALLGLAIPLRDIANLLGDIEKLDKNSPLALLLPDLTARDLGEAAANESARIVAERKAAREAIAAEEQKELQERQARARSLAVLLSTTANDQKKLRERQEKQDKKAAQARAAEKARTEPLRALRQQLRYQLLINAGKERQAFIEREIAKATQGRVLTEKELAFVTKASGKLYDAMQDKDKPEKFDTVSKGMRLAGIALKGSAEAARTTVGGAATIEKQIESNTKKTAKNTEQMSRDIKTLANSRPVPANFRR